MIFKPTVNSKILYYTPILNYIYQETEFHWISINIWPLSRGSKLQHTNYACLVRNRHAGSMLMLCHKPGSILCWHTDCYVILTPRYKPQNRQTVVAFELHEDFKRS